MNKEMKDAHQREQQQQYRRRARWVWGVLTAFIAAQIIAAHAYLYLT